MRHRQVLLAFLLSIWLLICSAGDISAQKHKPSTMTGASPLTLKITTAARKVCRQTKTIPLEAEIKNISQRNITIDKYFLWHHSVSVFLHNKKGTGGGWATSGDAHGAGDYLRLTPGETYRETYDLPVNEGEDSDDFFRDVDSFSVRVRYQAVKLNKYSGDLARQIYTEPIIATLQIRFVKCREKNPALD